MSLFRGDSEENWQNKWGNLLALLHQLSWAFCSCSYNPERRWAKQECRQWSRGPLWDWMEQPLSRASQLQCMPTQCVSGAVRKAACKKYIIIRRRATCGLTLCSSKSGLWTSSVGLTQEFLRNVESQIPSQTHWNRICMLTRSLDDSYVQYSLEALVSAVPYLGLGEVGDMIWMCMKEEIRQRWI